jgi:hypothetical protein
VTAPGRLWLVCNGASRGPARGTSPGLSVGAGSFADVFRVWEDLGKVS